VDKRAKSRTWVDRHLAPLLLLLGGVFTAVVTLHGTVWSGRLQREKNTLDQELARQKLDNERVIQQEAARTQFNLQEMTHRHERKLEICRKALEVFAHNALARTVHQSGTTAGQFVVELPTCLDDPMSVHLPSQPGAKTTHPEIPTKKPVSSQPTPTPKRISLSATSYASSDRQNDKDSVKIPDGCTYVSHASRVTTRNISDETSFKIDPSQPTSQTREITVSTKAKGRPLFGERRWIGVELSVVVECTE
jgi:FtsZ-interacting cell division protein ZipA